MATERRPGARRAGAFDAAYAVPLGASGFRGERLRLARLFRGMTLEELGACVAATRQYIHQLETSTGKVPTVEMTDALAAALGVLPAFFAMPLLGGIAPEHCHFRKQATTPQAIVQQVLARGTLLDLALAAIGGEVDLPSANLPTDPGSRFPRSRGGGGGLPPTLGTWTWWTDPQHDAGRRGRGGSRDALPGPVGTSGRALDAPSAPAHRAEHDEGEHGPPALRSGARMRPLGDAPGRRDG